MTNKNSEPLFTEGHLIFVRRFLLIVTPLMFIWQNWGYNFHGIRTLIDCVLLGHRDISVDAETSIVFGDIEALSHTLSHAVLFTILAAVVYWTFYKLAPLACDTQRELIRKKKRRSLEMQFVLRNAEIINQLKGSQASEIELRRLLADVVEDLVETDDRGRRVPSGTQVREDILGKDRDSVFPLQAALGYSITQSLFIGKHTILVEGPSDILYLQALSSELANRGRTALDARWVICPSGGLDNIKAFVSLFAGNDLDVIAVTDYSKKDARKIEKLKTSEILKAGGTLTFADFVDNDEADVEDLFEPQLLCDIINAAYDLSPEHSTSPEKLAAANESTTRLVKQAESHFNLLPDSFPLYNHFTPSSWLISNPDALTGDDQHILDTLERAENLFTEINKLVG